MIRYVHKNCGFAPPVDKLSEDAVRHIEKGVPVTLFVTRESGRLEVRKIDPEQACFWTPEWHQGEREADEDIQPGRVVQYYSDKELLTALEADLKFVYA